CRPRSFRRSLRQVDSYGLADTEFLRTLGPRLDQKYQFGALLLTVNHRRGKFGAACNEADPRGQILVAAVAGYSNDVAVFELGEHGLRREEPDLQVAGRQQGHDRPAGRHGFARPVVNLFDGAIAGTVGVAAGKPRLRPLEIGFGLAQRRLGIVVSLLRAGGGSQQFLRTIERLLRIHDGRVPDDDIRLLQIIVHREQLVALLDVITLPNFQCFDAPLLVGRDKNQLGFDPTLQNAVVAVVTACECKRHENERQTGKSPVHGTLPCANNRSRCVFIILRTSSGSKRSNKPFQTMATSPGAAMICGKSASPSGTSPRAAARCSNARTAAMMRERTSR